MKIQELLMNIRNKEFKLEKGLEVKKYLPIDVKKTIAQGIVYECSSDNDGVIKVDSVQRYISYVRYMITMHTNLEYTDDDYDTLCSTEYGEVTLLNAIMDCFAEDAQECSRILNLVTDDFVQDISIEVTVARFLNGLNETIGGIVNKIGSVDLKSIIPSSVDMNKLGAFLQNYIK